MSGNFIAQASDRTVGYNYYINSLTHGHTYVSAWDITADGTVNSGTVLDMTAFNGENIKETNELVVEADVSTVNVETLFENKYELTISGDKFNENILKGYSDSACETSVDLTKVSVPAAGTTVYVKVSSPDGTATSDTVYKVVISKKVAYDISNTGKGSTYLQMYNGTDYYWVGWRGEVNATGAAVTAIENHRVGAIYMSSTTNLESVKADITAAVADMKDVDEIDTAVETVNAAYAEANNIKTYAMRGNKVFTWDNATQSYGYRYNFLIPEDYYRGVVMYVVYKDSDGNIQVEFSDMVVQQSGAVLEGAE